MVERQRTEKPETFEGVVEIVERTTSQDGTAQYHIAIRPSNLIVTGSTGQFHDWVTHRGGFDAPVTEGSVLDRYLAAVERAVPTAKNAAKAEEALTLMRGKKFRFLTMPLGTTFHGHPARMHFVPVNAL